MGWFIVSLVLIVVAIVLFILFFKSRKVLKGMRAKSASASINTGSNDDPRSGGYGYRQTTREQDEADRKVKENDQKLMVMVFGIAACIFLFLGILTLGLDSYSKVDARNLGIPVTQGVVGDPLNPGPHMVAPWTDVVTVDATTQNINRNTDEGQWADQTHPVCTAVLVRLASGANACADITGQWNVSQDSKTASTLWVKYRGNNSDADKTNDNFIDNLKNNVVDREIQRAMNAAFASYNPIVVGSNNQATNTPLDLDKFSKDVLDDLKKNVGDGLVMDKLTVSHVHFDRVTQDKINAFAQAKADTQIATQQALTAVQQKLANDALASGSSNDPGVQFQNCLNLVEKLSAKGQLGNLPVNTLQCVAGGGPNGTPIIVNGTKK